MTKKAFASRELIGENRPTLWIAPLLAVVTLFYLYPAFEVLRFSITDASLLEPDYKYTLNTFVNVLSDPVLYKVLRITIIFVLASVVLQLALGLLIAVAVNRARRRRLPGMVFMRSIILSAWVMPGVVIGIVWAIIFNEASYGLANLVLAPVGLDGFAWLSDPNLALMSIIIANVWRGTAFSMILQYAGLQSIPDELYEAAEVDGANALQSLEHHHTAAQADTHDQRHPDHYLHPQHLRHDIAAHRWGPRAGDGGALPPHVQHHLQGVQPGRRRRARRDHAVDQPDHHPRLQEIAAFGRCAVRSRKAQGRIGDVLTYLVFALALVFFGGPLLWVLSLSIRTQQEVYITSLRLIPESPTLENYGEVLYSAQFSVFLINSLKLSVAGSVGAMVVAAPAAYAFSRLDFRGNNTLLIGVLALQMISPLVIIIPLYRYFARLNLLDSHFSTAMVYIAILVPLATWMLKGFFDGIPPALDEAAMVDGCTRFGAFLRVTLPLILPGLTSVFVLTAILAWGEFIVPYILLSQPSLLPISIGILNFQGNYAETSTQVVAAGGVLAMLPAIATFVILQRFIVRALTSGAIKG